MNRPTKEMVTILKLDKIVQFLNRLKQDGAQNGLTISLPDQNETIL
jgi:hypothetical protein